MVFQIKVAGAVFRIHSLHSYIYEYCSDFLTEDEPDFDLTICEEDIIREQQRSMKDDPDSMYPDSYLETLAVYRKIAEQLMNRNTLLFHGSALAMDGTGILFTAPSGTGKSTHARLWRESLGDRVTMINDDKPLIRIAEEKGGSPLVYGTPWNGKHRLGSNTSAPLRAVCILERGETNEIHPISFEEACPILIQQTYRSQQPELVMRALTMIDAIGSSAAFFRLHCNMDPEAARVSYQGIMEYLKNNDSI